MVDSVRRAICHPTLYEVEWVSLWASEQPGTDYQRAWSATYRLRELCATRPATAQTPPPPSSPPPVRPPAGTPPSPPIAVVQPPPSPPTPPVTVAPPPPPAQPNPPPSGPSSVDIFALWAEMNANTTHPVTFSGGDDSALVLPGGTTTDGSPPIARGNLSQAWFERPAGQAVLAQIGRLLREKLDSLDRRFQEEALTQRHNVEHRVLITGIIHVQDEHWQMGQLEIQPITIRDTTGEHIIGPLYIDGNVAGSLYDEALRLLQQQPPMACSLDTTLQTIFLGGSEHVLYYSGRGFKLGFTLGGVYEVP